MQTHTHVTYTFDELSEDAQQKALDEMRYKYSDLYAWHDENVASLKAFLKCFSIDKFDYSVSTYGHSYATVKEWDLPDWEYWDTYDDLHHYVLNCILDENKSCPFTGYCMDETLLQPVRDFLANPEDERTLYELLNDCLSEWVKDYVNDWEWTYSDESLKELAEINEWQFNEDGSIH